MILEKSQVQALINTKNVLSVSLFRIEVQKRDVPKISQCCRVFLVRDCSSQRVQR
jgi:hypothetical protein